MLRKCFSPRRMLTHACGRDHDPPQHGIAARLLFGVACRSNATTNMSERWDTAVCAQARAMVAAYPYHVAAEDVAELIASDAGDPEYLVRALRWCSFVPLC